MPYQDMDVGSSKNNKSTRNTGSSGSVDLGSIVDIVGGLFGGNKQKKIAEENYRQKIEREKIAYERSLPWNSESALGSVTFDPETKMMLQSLSPEMQALMGNFLGQSTASSNELARLTADPYAMEQEQFQRFEDMNANAYNQSRLQNQEATIAQGREGTQGYYDSLATEDAINQNRLGGQMASISTGMDYRNMLTGESLNFGKGAIDVGGSLSNQADLGRLIGQGSNFGGGSNAVATAGSNYADTKSNFYTGMLGQGKKYNSDGKLIQDKEDSIFNKFSSIFT
jgi:hypothetical protein